MTTPVIGNLTDPVDLIAAAQLRWLSEPELLLCFQHIDVFPRYQEMPELMYFEPHQGIFFIRANNLSRVCFGEIGRQKLLLWKKMGFKTEIPSCNPTLRYFTAGGAARTAVLAPEDAESAAENDQQHGSDTETDIDVTDAPPARTEVPASKRKVRRRGRAGGQVVRRRRARRPSHVLYRLRAYKQINEKGREEGAWALVHVLSCATVGAHARVKTPTSYSTPLSRTLTPMTAMTPNTPIRTPATPTSTAAGPSMKRRRPATSRGKKAGRKPPAKRPATTKRSRRRIDSESTFSDSTDDSSLDNYAWSGTAVSEQQRYQTRSWRQQITDTLCSTAQAVTAAVVAAVAGSERMAPISRFTIHRDQVLADRHVASTPSALPAHDDDDQHDTEGNSKEDSDADSSSEDESSERSGPRVIRCLRTEATVAMLSPAIQRISLCASQQQSTAQCLEPQSAAPLPRDLAASPPTVPDEYEEDDAEGDWPRFDHEHDDADSDAGYVWPSPPKSAYAPFRLPQQVLLQVGRGTP